MSADALERLRIVAAAAHADGSVAPAERALLERLAAKLGGGAGALDLQGAGPLVRPAPGDEDAVLGWLLEVVRAGGVVSSAEEQFVRRVAQALGRAPAEVEALLRAATPAPAVEPAAAAAGGLTTATPATGAPAADPLVADAPPGPAPSAASQEARGPFGGALQRDGDVWVERAEPALIAALGACVARTEHTLAPTEPAPGRAGLAPWSVDAAGRLLHTAPGRAAAATLPSVAAAAGAMADLHERGVVHGDLRPEALRAREDGAPLLLTPAAPVDALALLRARLRAADADPTTVAYAAPEVLAGRAATAAADVYSLAALAYRALSGQAPLGQVDPPRAVPGATGLSTLVTRGLSAAPERRPRLPALSQALVAAATPPPAEAPGLAGGFELVEDAAPGAFKARLVGAPGDDEPWAGDAAAPRAEGAQVSAILMLVLGLGGIFVLVGAIGLALLLGGPGLFGLLLLLTAGAFVGGGVAERRGSPRGGLALIGVATQLLWADAAYLLNVFGLLESSLAWCVVAIGVAVVTGATARRRGSIALWVLAGLGATVACACLWSSVGPGGRAFLLAAAAGSLLVGGHAVHTSGRDHEGLALLHVGCLLLLAVAAQVLHLSGRLDDAMSWAVAAGACAVMTGLVAGVVRSPGLWVVAVLDALLALGCLWSALESTGRGALVALVAVGLSIAGQVLLSRDGERLRNEGQALLLLGGAVAWGSAWYLLDGQDLARSAGAWVVAGAAITGVAYGLAALHRAPLLSTLGAVDLSITAMCLGAYLSTGTLHGPALFTGLVTAAYVVVAALTHALGGLALAAPASIGAGLWAWASAVCGLAVMGEEPEGLFGVVWPFSLMGLAGAAALAGPRGHRPIAAAAAAPLVALVPTVVAILGHESVGYLQLALVASFVVIAAAFHVPVAAATSARQVLTILPALVPATLAPFLLCLAKCAGRDGVVLLGEALQTLGKVHETRFAFLASVVGASSVLVGLGFVFAPRAASRAAYRLLEAAGLLLFFGTFTILSLARVEDWFYPLVLLVGVAVIIALGVWQRRAVLVACAGLALVLNLWLQYFAKLHEHLPTFGLLLGFGIGLLGFGLLYERRVKRILPVLREWA